MLLIISKSIIKPLFFDLSTSFAFKIVSLLFFIASIIFLIIMTKQNIGIFYILAYIVAEFISKKEFKSILRVLNTTITMLFAYAIYLFFKGNLNNFINYTILGIKEFSQNITIKGIVFILIDLIFLIFLFIVILKKKNKSHTYKNILILYVFGAFLLLTGYPIADNWHMVIASTVLWICMIYTIHNMIIAELKIKKSTIKLIKIIICIIILVICAGRLIIFASTLFMEKTNKFYLIPISKTTKEKIDIMEEYILNSNKKVIIASAEARNV